MQTKMRRLLSVGLFVSVAFICVRASPAKAAGRDSIKDVSAAEIQQETNALNVAAHYFGPNGLSSYKKSSKTLKAQLSAKQTAPSVCEAKESSSVFAYGKCPETCGPFSSATYFECAGMAPFGCEFQICGPGEFTCTLNPALIEDIVVCPGDKVVLDSIPLLKLRDVKFFLDLSAPPKETDLYLLSDTTGSMSTAIRVVRDKIDDIINVFDRPNVAIGLGEYRDESELTDGFSNLVSITKDLPPVRAAASGLVARGGGDRDEANLVALYKIATDPSIAWREGSRKFLVYFGDNPGHETSCVSGLPPLTRNIVVNALNEKNITVIAVDFGSMDSRSPTSYGCPGSASSGQTTFITNGTSGSYVPSDNQALLISNIEDGIDLVTREYDVDESECVANVEATFDPSLPLSLPGGASTTVTQTLSIRPAICEIVGPFTCDYKYTESGADIGASVVEVVNVLGCPER